MTHDATAANQEKLDALYHRHRQEAADILVRAKSWAEIDEIQFSTVAAQYGDAIAIAEIRLSLSRIAAQRGLGAAVQAVGNLQVDTADAGNQVQAALIRVQAEAAGQWLVDIIAEAEKVTDADIAAFLAKQSDQ